MNYKGQERPATYQDMKSKHSTLPSTQLVQLLASTLHPKASTNSLLVQSFSMRNVSYSMVVYMSRSILRKEYRS